MYFDKYAGMKVTENELADFIRTFFFNGKIVKIDAMREVLRQCEELIEALKFHDPFSIFSSSLLIVFIYLFIVIIGVL